MEFDRSYFAGKSCAVTGAASGIGLALCEELLQSGAARVTMADFNADNLKAHAERLSAQYPGRVQGKLCNVTHENEVSDMVQSAAAFGDGRLDLLVNCAGAAFAGRFCDLSESGADSATSAKVQTNEDWRRAFALNFYGALYGCRVAIPIMVKHGGGQIVNIISGIAFSPMAYQSMYAATKAALCALSLSLRAEYEAYGVKVTPATPGTTATAIFAGGNAPPEAQSPHASAQRILSGIVANERVICGDDSDRETSRLCFFPDGLGKELDKIFLGFARQRRSGTLSFVAEPPDLSAYGPILAMLHQERAKDLDAVDAYIAQRDAEGLDRDYYREKTAVVTGGASGVGLALATLLLECGAKKVVLVDYDRAHLAEREKALNARFPARVKGVFCDVSKEESVQAMVAEALAFFGDRLDLLINCAGIGQMGMFVALPDSEEVAKRAHMAVESSARWEQVYAVNFYGPLYGCRAALPIMKRQGGGQIVNIISGAAFSALPFQTIYASSKAALNLLTLTLRYEYWDDHILLNAATPGTTATAIFREGETPADAQSPERSALRILTGVARNDRVILGDDADMRAAIAALNPGYAALMDQVCNGIAESRRQGALNVYGLERE